jgi:hypothetical protein
MSHNFVIVKLYTRQYAGPRYRSGSVAGLCVTLGMPLVCLLLFPSLF